MTPFSDLDLSNAILRTSKPGRQRDLIISNLNSSNIMDCNVPLAFVISFPHVSCGATYQIPKIWRKAINSNRTAQAQQTS